MFHTHDDTTGTPKVQDANVENGFENVGSKK